MSNGNRDNSQIQLEDIGLGDSNGSLSASSSIIRGNIDREIDILDRDWTVRPTQSRTAGILPFVNAFFLTIATVLVLLAAPRLLLN